MNFQLLAAGIDVEPTLRELDTHPNLWDQNRARTSGVTSPHRESSDIVIRYRAIEELREPVDYVSPHLAVFWPAWHALPSLKPIVFRVAALCESTCLGGILITRIPAGRRIYPHTDGGWHAQTMNCKVYVILQANDHCFNRCGDETAVMRAGEAWRFNNLIEHSVENRGDTDRIAMIITMRTED